MLFSILISFLTYLNIALILEFSCKSKTIAREEQEKSKTKARENLS